MIDNKLKMDILKSNQKGDHTMKIQTEEELVQEIKKYYALLRYYNCLYEYHLIEDKTNLDSNVFIINELKQAILNLLTANPNEDFSLKEATGDNFLISYMYRNIICDVTRSVYQYYNQSDDLKGNEDFKSDDEYICFVNNMPDKELKKQLQVFNREAAILEGRRSSILSPISRDETIEKFKNFSGKSFSEVLLCVDEEHPHFETSKNIILYLNQARECGKLTDRQFRVFVKEYVEQLLDIIYQKNGSRLGNCKHIDRCIKNIILSEISKIAPQEINNGFRDFLKDIDSDTFIDFLKFFFNETPYDKYLNIDELRKIVLEKLANYGNDENVTTKQHCKMVYEIFSIKNCILPREKTSLTKYFLDLSRKIGGRNPLLLILLQMPESIKLEDTLDYIRNQNPNNKFSIDFIIHWVANSIYDDSEEANITAFIEKLRKLKKRLAIEEIQQEIISNYRGVMPNELRLLLKKRKYPSEVIEEISKMKRKCDLRKAKVKEKYR